jgi:KipI family sensor histidine kinase inhibitor
VTDRGGGEIGRPGAEEEGDGDASGHRLVMAGDSALLVELGSGNAAQIDSAVNDRVVTLARAVRDASIPGVRDVVPAFSSLAVHFDPLRTSTERLAVLVEQLAETTRPVARAHAELVRVPVCYGGNYGPDLDAVASATGFEPSQVIDLHCAPTYRVFMMGFSPGFPYLGVVDTRLRVARRTVPRTEVAAGSVGLAGPQTGIYPTETPGGWQIIGRTPLRLFDLSRRDPCLMSAGCHVRFEPITASEYSAMVRSPA